LQGALIYRCGTVQTLQSTGCLGPAEVPPDACSAHHAVDPEAFECPFSACAYDCQKRAPVRVPCPCKHLVCRKCAAVSGASPHGCGLCLRPGAPGYSGVPECRVDTGLLLALASELPSPEP
jgi:hypothetical protein